jgi:Family of unknown function (DUF6174)
MDTREQAPVGWAALMLASGLLLLVGSAGCTRDLSEIRERQAAWAEAGIEDYSWSLTVSEPVFGPRRLDVKVEHGEPQRVMLDGQEVPRDQADNLPLTVDDLYTRLLDTAGSAVSLEVIWNADPAYPSRIQIDESDALDDELTYEVLQLELHQA